MTRIYKQTEYGSLYQGFARDKPFEQVQPLDESNAIQKRAEDKINNIKNLAAAARTQATLDQATLQGNQTIARAKFDGTWSTVKGILDLSKTGIELYKAIDDHKKEKEVENDLLNSLGYYAENPKELDLLKEENKNESELIDINSNVIKDEATILISEEDGSGENVDVANQLLETSLGNQIINLEGDVLAAVALHQPYLRERFSLLSADEIPKDITSLNALLKQFNADFLRQAGLTDKALKKKVLEYLAKPMYQNTANFAAEIHQNIIKGTHKENRAVLDTFVSQVIDNDELSLQEKWNQISTKFNNANIGILNRGEVNRAALEQLLKELSLSGPEAVTDIEALKDILKIDGQSGTELGKEYSDLFDKYELEAREHNVRQFNLEEREASNTSKDLYQQFLDNPNADTKNAVIEALRAENTPESILRANELANTGDNYDPNTAIDLKLRMSGGEEIDDSEIDRLLDNGLISFEEHQELKSMGPLRATKLALNTYLTNNTDAISSYLMKGLDLTEAFNTTTEGLVNAKAITLRGELEKIMLAELRVNPSIISNPVELEKLFTEKLNQLLDLPRYKLVQTESGFQFETVDTNKNLAEITIVGQPGSENYSGFTIDQLFEENKFHISEMNPSDDYFFTKEQIEKELETFELTNFPSEKLTKLAERLGYSPRAFLNEQLRLHKIYGNEAADLTNIKFDTDETELLNIDDTFKWAVKLQGFSTNGSAYFAAALQNSFGFELNEENTVISSVFNNEVAIKALEEQFDKPLAEITQKEQIRYLIRDIYLNHPDLTKALRDPYTSEDELKAALAKYLNIQDTSVLDKHVNQLLNR